MRYTGRGSITTAQKLSFSWFERFAYQGTMDCEEIAAHSFLLMCTFHYCVNCVLVYPVSLFVGCSLQAVSLYGPYIRQHGAYQHVVVFIVGADEFESCRLAEKTELPVYVVRPLS
jgi:hypothetical protein